MIHRSLSHPFIVDFLTYFEDDLHVYIILEICTKKVGATWFYQSVINLAVLTDS